MRRSRRLRRSVDNVLAEERREWERQALAAEPHGHPPPRPASFRRNLVWQALVVLGAGGLGAAAGDVAGDRPTGAALGVAAGILLSGVVRRAGRSP